MISRHFPVLALILGLAVSARAADDSFKAPDSLVLKDGRVIHGLIVKNARDYVLIQEKQGENTYKKSDITRIRDEADINTLFTDINRKGDLPAWRVIANDLRMHDEIKSLYEIPPTVIDNGEFKNVPYKSFRVNNNVEMNVYGDPENPAGIEMGIYGSKSGDDKLRKVLRAYMAGFLTTRAEIAALYALSFKGEIRQAGTMVLEITPADGPDAYGAWWISLYNKEKLAAARLSDAKYNRIVRPVADVMDRKGRILNPGWTPDETTMSEKIEDLRDTANLLLRGFYRDKNGDLRLITAPFAPPVATAPRQ